MKWVTMTTPPPESGLYYVYAPSSDPTKPFYHIAWFISGKGWGGLVPHWLRALTHWMKPEPPEETK